MRDNLTRYDTIRYDTYEDVARSDVAMHDALGVQVADAARRAQRNVTQIATIITANAIVVVLFDVY